MKVDPERNRRYILRTLTRPEPSYVVTCREKALLDRWEAAFYRNNADPEERPGLWDWRARVERYAKAKGFRVSFTVEERPDDLSTVLRWDAGE